MLRDDLEILKKALCRLDLELRLLDEGGKRVVKKEPPTEAEALRLAEHYRSNGLYVAIVREPDGQTTGCGRRGDLAPAFMVIASRDAATVEEAVEWTRVEVSSGGDARLRGRARLRMGRLLGYPDCCVEFYEDLDIRNDEEAVYAAWRGTKGTVRGPILATGLGGYSVLSHAPCSFTCEPTSRVADRILDLLRRADEEAWRAAVRVSAWPLLYAGDRRRFSLEGSRDEDGAIRYRDVQPAHYISGEDATDWGWLRALRRGNRLKHFPDRVEVFRGERHVATLDVGESIRPLLLLVPGETIEHRRLRVAVFETVNPDQGDLFGHMRASLLAGDLKAAGYRVRAYTWSAPREGNVAAVQVAEALAAARTDVVIFVRTAPREILDALALVLPDARRWLIESGEPHDAPPDLEIVPLGRLPVLRRLDALSVGKAGRASEPLLYVGSEAPYHPEVQRAFEAPGLLPAIAPRAWEVLGRLGCPYRRPAWSNRAFAGVNMDKASPLSRGCTMCSFRTGRWGRVRPEEWLDSVCRQMAWVRSLNPTAFRFRLVDHHGLEYIRPLLRRFRDLGWTGLTLMLDARVDQTLGRDDWEEVAEEARAVGARLDLTCIGFENFSQSELDRLNKGVTVAQNVAAANLVRALWERHPEVFVRLHAAAGFVTWTPWTTLDDLRENVKHFRALRFSDFRSDLASLRLRLYPDLPLYALAAKDGLLLDEWPPDWEKPVGYSADHPWRFQSQETASAYALVRRLLREGEPGRDVEVLDLAVRLMERRLRGEGRAQEHPRNASMLGREEALAYVGAILGGGVCGPSLHAVSRVLGDEGPYVVVGAGTWCGKLLGFRAGRLFQLQGEHSTTAILEVLRGAGLEVGLGDLPATHEAPFRRLLSIPADVSSGVSIEVEHTAEGPKPVVRADVRLTAPAEDLVARLVGVIGGGLIDLGRTVAPSRVKSLALEWTFSQPLRARVALATNPRQRAVMNLAATNPLGVRLLAGCTELWYEMPVGRPDHGTLLFRMAADEDLGALLVGLEPSPLFTWLERLSRASVGLSVTAVPVWVAIGVSGRLLDVSVGEVRFDVVEAASSPSKEGPCARPTSTRQ